MHIDYQRVTTQQQPYLWCCAVLGSCTHPSTLNTTPRRLAKSFVLGSTHCSCYRFIQCIYQANHLHVLRAWLFEVRRRLGSWSLPWFFFYPLWLQRRKQVRAPSRDNYRGIPWRWLLLPRYLHRYAYFKPNTILRMWNRYHSTERSA